MKTSTDIKDVAPAQRKLLWMLLRTAWRVLRGKAGVYILVVSDEKTSNVETRSIVYTSNLLVIFGAIKGGYDALHAISDGLREQEAEK